MILISKKFGFWNGHKNFKNFNKITGYCFSSSKLNIFNTTIQLPLKLFLSEWFVILPIYEKFWNLVILIYFELIRHNERKQTSAVRMFKSYFESSISCFPLHFEPEDKCNYFAITIKSYYQKRKIFT